MRPQEQRALLALLGVDESAGWNELRRAFRAAVRASHPDLHADDPDAESHLKALNAAWESVNTPSKWAAYARQSSPGPWGGSSDRARDGAAVPTLGRLRVHRQQQGSYGLASWNLELDGAVIGSLENGGISVLDTGPGRHSLRVFYGSRSSLPLQVDLHRGHELLLRCRTPESLRLSLFYPQRSLLLELIGKRRFAAGR